MRRDATGKFARKWELEAKQRVSLTLTNTAWQLLKEEAQKNEISRSEVIERIARCCANCAPDQTQLEEAYLRSQELIQEQQQTIATLQRQKQELETLLEEAQPRTQLIAAQKTDRRVIAILESISDAFVAFDRNWCYTYINQTAAKILGKTPEEILGQHVWNEVFPELVGGIAYQQLHRAMAEQISVDWEECEPLLQRCLEVKAYPSDEGIALYFRDITAQKQLETQLQQQEQQFKMLAENAPDIIARFDSEFRHLYVSPSVERATGLPATALIGKTNAELGVAEDLCLLWHEGLEQVFTTRQEQKIEFQFATPTGNRWYQSRLVPELAADGSIASVLSVTRDFEDYKQAEQALRQSEERLRFALEAAEMVAWEWHPTTGQVVRSHTAQKLVGLDSDAVLEDTSEFLNVIHPDDRDSVARLLEQAIHQRSPYAVEFRMIKPDGSLRWMFDQGRAICNPAGDLIRMSGVIQDITERKQVEFALRDSELKFRTLADTMPQLFWITRPDGYHEYFNQRWFEYTGMTLEQTQGWGWHHLLHPDDRQRCLTVWQESLRTGNNYTIEYRFQQAKSGEYRWFLGRAFPLRDQDGQVMKWFGSCTDIHDQRCLLEERDRAFVQEQLARQQAETANRIKDEFLAVLSHELRTPLNPILGWSSLLKRGKLDANQSAAALAAIERNARLQIQLIDDLLDISRILQGKLSLKSVPVDLKTTITDAIETVDLAAEAKAIQIQTYFETGVHLVLGDAARLQQVIWNLLTNAVKFTPEGGQVQVRLDVISSASGTGDRASVMGNGSLLTRETKAPQFVPSPHHQAQITITDTGRGITPDFLPYVFEYFRQADSSTTRQFGGLGLGLAIVHHLVELHGGMVEAASLGQGTGATFVVRLPLLESRGEREREKNLHSLTPSPLRPFSGVKILIVEDEADMRELIGFILEEQGATVRVAASAAEALQQIPQFLPDILISDIGMPEMDGYGLMHQVRTLPPERGGSVPAIALTAYAGERNQRQALASGFQQHLPKPIEPEVLVRTIAMLVNQE
jgi:PAS domain S-box-containing protein